MTIQRMSGSAITPGTITITQLESNVATVVSTGGGPKITNIQVTDNAYTVLDDTAVDITGGYIKITGTGFVTGCSVIVGQLPAASVTFISSTEVRAQLSAQSAGTYIVYLVNPDGGVGIRVNGVTHSANPAWQTASGLPEQYDGVAINLSLVATDATSYTITSGSLPPGLSLNSNTGVISGTVSGVANDTLYTFTVRATDAQLQDSPRTFTVTITVSDPYFRLTTLLLSGSAVSANTVIKDSSTNNFNLTVYGDARASNRTPYGSGWSNLFSSNRLNIATTGFAPGTGNFTVEAWIYPTSYNSSSTVFTVITTGGLWLGKLNSNWVLRAYNVADQLTTTTLPMLNTWTHVAWVRNGSTATIYFNGNSVVSGTVTYNFVSGGLAIGDDGAGTSYFLGYISNLRYTTTAVYTANFTPATTNLTALAGTQLLTCQDNRFRDTSANAYTITTTGTPTVSSFNPFNITNTGVNGSAYFDGTGDYISSQSSTAFAFDTNSYTIEFWFNASNTQTGGVNDYTFLVDCRTVSGGDSPVITVQNGAIGFQTELSGLNITASLVPYRWYHAAMVRDATNNKLWCFLDGTALVVGGTTYSGSTSAGTTARSLVIGARYSIERHYNGYISDLRVLKGTALYTSNFTPPTQPLTAITNTQLLTLQYDQPHNNHTFLDSSSNQFVITRNGNATQGTFSPFSQSGWSNYFPSTAYLNIGTTAAFSFGTGDFTAEGWIYTNSTTVCMFDARSAGSASPWVLNAGSGSSTYYYDGTSYTSSIGITLGQWNHVAAARQSGVLRIFVNGQQGYSSSHTVNQDRTAGIRIGDVVQTGQNWTGYLSNLRIVKGQALYTGSFTPPTTVLATNSVGTTGANVAVSITSPVSLLTAQSNRFIDNSSNNFAITATNSPQVQAFSPFAPTAVYNPVSHGGSVYLDGTGDYLNTGSDVGLNLGVGNFTWEFWTYLTVSPVDGNVLFQPRTPAGIDAVLFGYKSGSNFTIYATTDGGGSWNLFSNTVIIAVADVLNRWAHWAFTRNGNTYTVYVDGVSKVTGTSANQISQATNVFTLGATVSGYFSGFRFVKAQALSTGNFTPPAAPLTANTIGWTGANVATSLTGTVNFLLNFTDAAILDSTGRQVLETVADSKTSSVVTKFAGGSMLFDGTGDYLTIPSPPGSTLDLKSGDFTIEAWINYSTANSTICAIYRIGDSAVTQYIFIVNSTNKLEFTVYASSNSFNSIASSGNISTNTWTHVAVTRAANTLRLFINGVLDGTTTVTVGDLMTLTGSTKFSVGAWSSLGPPATVQGFFNGYIQDLRITKGYARYTANFTAPTGPARLK